MPKNLIIALTHDWRNNAACSRDEFCRPIVSLDN
jgi:hypothetical protein